MGQSHMGQPQMTDGPMVGGLGGLGHHQAHLGPGGNLVGIGGGGTLAQRASIGIAGLAIRKMRAREGKETRARPYSKTRCPHNRDHYSCRECGGAGICVHNRRKSQVRWCVVAYSLSPSAAP